MTKKLTFLILTIICSAFIFNIFIQAAHAEKVMCCQFYVTISGLINPKYKDQVKKIYTDKDACIYDTNIFTNSVAKIPMTPENANKLCNFETLAKIFGDTTLPEYCCVKTSDVKECRPIKKTESCNSDEKTHWATCDMMKIYDPRYCQNIDILRKINKDDLNLTASAAQKTAVPDAIPFVPQVDYGIKFDPVTQGRYLEINWLAQFIIWAYKYAVGISAVFGTIMIMLGGIMYIMAAGDQGKITKAKEIIQSAVSGMVLIIAASFILYYINPAIIDVKPLRLQLVTLPSAAKSQFKECEVPKDVEKQTAATGGKQYCIDISKPGLYYNLADSTYNEKNLTDAQKKDLKNFEFYKPILKYSLAPTDAYLTFETYKKLLIAAKILSDYRNEAELHVKMAIQSAQSMQKNCNCHQQMLKNKKENVTPPCPSDCTAAECSDTAKPSCSYYSAKGQAVIVTLGGKDTKKNSTILGKPYNCGSLDTTYNCRKENISTKGSNCQPPNTDCQDVLYFVMTSAGFKANPANWFEFYSP